MAPTATARSSRSIPTAATYQVLYSFTGGTADGANPDAGLTLVGSTLYGTTTSGGTRQRRHGLLDQYAIGSGYQVLHSFSDGRDGANPSGLTLVGSTLYGTTDEGGSDGDGTVFSINTDGSDYQVSAFVTGAGQRRRRSLMPV